MRPTGDACNHIDEELWLKTKTRRAYLNITPEVEAAVPKSGIREGLVLVHAMYTTSRVWMSDEKSGLPDDSAESLARLASQQRRYRHDNSGGENGGAHIKRQLMDREVGVALTDGCSDFKPRARSFYGAFDGRRRTRVLVKIMGE